MAKQFRNLPSVAKKQELSRKFNSADIVYGGLQGVVNTPRYLWNAWQSVNGSQALRQADPSGYRVGYGDFSRYGFQRFWVSAGSFLMGAVTTSTMVGPLLYDSLDSKRLALAGVMAFNALLYAGALKTHSLYHIGRLRAADPSRRLEHRR